MSQPVRPEDLLPDGADTCVINDVEVRKGSVAAFVANAKRLDGLELGTPEDTEVRAQLRKLVPALRAVGVLDVFTVRSETLADLIAHA
ncbi:hypothetical protein [Streptantibioticus silvisoli]|uniref:STAS domain-containing protein n=1 Tax=Streptantibioticus silvisoli TaxID=2705255 RepID=A0ABT6W8I4_9ACTN|nr:hypothetical protein [Streptantibioticus silvisoli]MDI5967065.1 hypothetical protein [Streptantibioticus silvisoli]